MTYKKYWVHPWETDAPEQIWAWGWRADSPWQGQTWQLEDEPISTMKYVRGDLIAVLEAKLAKAVGTLELIQMMDVHELIDIETYEPCGEDLGTCGRLARDTLAELKEETHDRPTTES